MQELVKIQEIQIGDENVNGCDARELHANLEVQTRFDMWIERRLKDAHLVAGKDYVSFAQICAKPKGGRPSTEYHLTLDSAKHIALMEGNEIGHRVRQYFIEFEKKAMAALRMIAADHERQLADLRQQVRLLTLRTAKPTNEQIFREGKELLEIEQERAKRRSLANLKQNQNDDTTDPQKSAGRETATGLQISAQGQPATGDARKVVAEKVGVSHDTLTKGIAVVETIDELEAAGQEDKAAELRETLNKKSVNAAHKLMRSLARQAMAGA